jgi:hypothetical protein
MLMEHKTSATEEKEKGEIMNKNLSPLKQN